MPGGHCQRGGPQLMSVISTLEAVFLDSVFLDGIWIFDLRLRISRTFHFWLLFT